METQRGRADRAAGGGRDGDRGARPRGSDPGTGGARRGSAGTAVSLEAVAPGRRPPRELPRDGITRLGERLRAERQRRGIGVEQVSESTKIRKPYLEALKRHDWDAFPGDVFTRGYLRTYAQYLGLDPEYVLKAYARERRISGVEDPSVSGLDERDAAKAVLARLAQTRGVEPARFGPTAKRIVLVLLGAGVAAVAVWIAL